MKTIMIMLVTLSLAAGCTSRVYNRQPYGYSGGRTGAYGPNNRYNRPYNDRREDRHERNEHERREQTYNRPYGY